MVRAQVNQEDIMRQWRMDPTKMVYDLFDVAPDAWQKRVLDAFPHNPRQAMKACKGPGKTALLAWLCWNFLLTRFQSNIGAVSITKQNLDDNLWKEMAKWQGKSKLLQARFEWTKTRIYAKEFPETWFMSAKSFQQSADREQQANTLAGFHADYIMFVLDESGGMPEAIMAAAEAALSSCIEGHIVQAGNPTHLSGPLYRASAIDRALWWVIEITGDPDDPMRSPRISKEWARAQITQYGRDNPWVLVNVFGEFPPSSLNVLIGHDEVRAAMQRVYRESDIYNSPKVMGIDVAREGDDKSVLIKRQGLQVFKPREWRNIDGTQGAGATAREWDDWGADAAFVDNTGGFGSSWIDQLKLLGKAPVPVHFAAEAHQKSRYYNKRTEMYFDAVQWIRDGGALYDSPEILGALTQTEYSFKGDRVLLEPKDVVKSKLGYSPDQADAFVLTFAEPVAARNQRTHRVVRQAASDFNPYRENA